jgi:hypothetical protein
MMVSPTFPPPLFGCLFGATKWHTAFQHAVKNDQHMIRHGDNRAFFAAPWCESLKARAKNRVTLPGCRPCILHQSRTQIRVAVGGLWSFLNACALPIELRKPVLPKLLNTRMNTAWWRCSD